MSKKINNDNKVSSLGSVILIVLILGATAGFWSVFGKSSQATAVNPAYMTPAVNLSHSADNRTHVGDTSQQTNVTIHFPTSAPTPFMTQAPTVTPQPTPTPVMEIPTLVYEVGILSSDVRSLKAVVHSLSMATPYPTPTPLPLTRIKQDVTLIAFGAPLSVIFLSLCVAFFVTQWKPSPPKAIRPVSAQTPVVVDRTASVVVRNSTVSACTDTVSPPVSVDKRAEMEEARLWIRQNVSNGGVVDRFGIPSSYEFTNAEASVLKSLYQNGASKNKLMLALWGQGGSKSKPALDIALGVV